MLLISPRMLLLTKSFRSEYWYCSGEVIDEAEEVAAVVATDDDMSRIPSYFSNSTRPKNILLSSSVAIDERRIKDGSICTTLVFVAAGAVTKAVAIEEGFMLLLIIMVASVKVAILLVGKEVVFRKNPFFLFPLVVWSGLQRWWRQRVV